MIIHRMTSLNNQECRPEIDDFLILPTIAQHQIMLIACIGSEEVVATPISLEILRFQALPSEKWCGLARYGHLPSSPRLGCPSHCQLGRRRVSFILPTQRDQLRNPSIRPDESKSFRFKLVTTLRHGLAPT